MLGGLKAFIPGTARYSQKHHVKYLQKKARGHDILLLVEWEDGKLTELGADIHPEMDGWYVATNNLIFAPAGEGADPVEYYGVPTIRCHAQIACPFSTSACLAADYDEAGEFRYEVDKEDGTTERVVEVEMGEQPETPGDPSTNGNSSGEVVGDGGQQMVREYDLRPPAGAVGHSFSLTQAKQRAPNAISANMIRRAVEYGKEKAREEGLYMRGLLHGAGLIIATIVILAILYIIGASVLGGGGGGGGGGGADVVSGSLLLLGAPGTRLFISELKAGASAIAKTIKSDPVGAAKRFTGSLLVVAVVGVQTVQTALLAVLMGEYLSQRPELASTPVQFGWATMPFAEFLVGVFTAAMLVPTILAVYVVLEQIEAALLVHRGRQEGTPDGE